MSASTSASSSRMRASASRRNRSCARCCCHVRKPCERKRNATIKTGRNARTRPARGRRGGAGQVKKRGRCLRCRRQTRAGRQGASQRRSRCRIAHGASAGAVEVGVDVAAGHRQRRRLCPCARPGLRFSCSRGVGRTASPRRGRGRGCGCGTPAAICARGRGCASARRRRRRETWFGRVYVDVDEVSEHAEQGGDPAAEAAEGRGEA